MLREKGMKREGAYRREGKLREVVAKTKSLVRKERDKGKRKA